MHKFKYVDGCALGIDKTHSGWKEAFRSAFKKLINDYNKVIFVFDGKVPPHKTKEHEHRRESNDRLRKLAKELLKNKETVLDAKKLLVKLIEVEELSCQLKELITEMGAEFIQSEYEADEKLARMIINKDIDVILTEDTDLIVYGCENIIFKFNGNKGLLYNRNKFIDQSGFNEWELFQRFCILCGCDYYKYKGIAINTAKRICKSMKSYNEWENKIDDESKKKINNVLNIFNLII